MVEHLALGEVRVIVAGGTAAGIVPSDLHGLCGFLHTESMVLMVGRRRTRQGLHSNCSSRFQFFWGVVNVLSVCLCVPAVVFETGSLIGLGLSNPASSSVFDMGSWDDGLR